MTPDEFRELALRFPETSESAHMEHPDFRVGGKIFATLSADGEWGMVKLPLDDQDGMIQAAPAIFSPAQGAWGRQGATRVRLAEANRGLVEQALESAWRARSPKTLVRKFDRERA